MGHPTTFIEIALLFRREFVWSRTGVGGGVSLEESAWWMWKEDADEQNRRGRYGRRS
jgi:hypothetical protein